MQRALPSKPAAARRRMFLCFSVVNVKTPGIRPTKLLIWILPLVFLGSCVGLLEPAARLADPLTRKPIDDRSYGPFPVLVVSADTAWVDMVGNPSEIPPPPTGASFLVPPGKVPYFEKYIREHDSSQTDSNWV